MIKDDPITSIVLFCVMGGVIVVVAPLVVWLVGEIGSTLTDLLPIFGEWYLEQWRRARDAWRR
jgi:hypothetical protein